MRRCCIIFLLFFSSLAPLRGQDVLNLWPGGAPGALGTEEADRPAITIFLPAPERAVGTAVVVLPGGGYSRHAMDHEGHQVAAWLNERGIAAFVLRYRLGTNYGHPVPLGDAQRAIRLVRHDAERFGVASDRIGIWGFSAGGHLASSASVFPDVGRADAPDPVDRVGSRPDFAVLAYPVITMEDPFTHAGSRRNLLGESPDPALVDLLSTYRQVSADTPPTFLFHTTEDTGVPPENSIFYYLALRRAGVPAELHIYEQGRHGVGLAPADPVLSTWTARLEDWLRVRGMLP